MPVMIVRRAFALSHLVSSPLLTRLPTKILPSCRGLGGLVRRERDRVPQLFEASDVVPFDPSRVEVVEVVGPQIGRGLLIAQEVVRDDQDALRHSNNGLLFAPPPGKAVKLGMQIGAALPGDRPGDLPQHGPQPGIAFGRLATQALAATLVVTRTDTSPRGQVPSRGEPPHIHADCSDQGRRRTRPHARDRLQQRRGFLVGSHVQIDVLLRLRQRLVQEVQEVDVRQDPLEEDQVVGLDPTVQGLA